MSNEQKGNWWIWKVFWILLIVTTVEVLLGIVQPEIIAGTQFLGTSLLNHIFIVLTLVKAGYIVLVFMHLGFERKSFKSVPIILDIELNKVSKLLATNITAKTRKTNITH